MSRNLDSRSEVAVPILDPEVKKQFAETRNYTAYADTRWTRIRENLPAEIRALLETDQAKGTRFRRL